MIRLQVLAAAGDIGEVPGVVSPLIDSVNDITGLTILVTTLIVRREARDAALQIRFVIHKLFLLFLHVHFWIFTSTKEAEEMDQVSIDWLIFLVV